jgi:hypothetical protein
LDETLLDALGGVAQIMDHHVHKKFGLLVLLQIVFVSLNQLLMVVPHEAVAAPL